MANIKTTKVQADKMARALFFSCVKSLSTSRNFKAQLSCVLDDEMKDIVGKKYETRLEKSGFNSLDIAYRLSDIITNAIVAELKAFNR